MTPRVREILSWYQGDPPVILDRLARVLNHGRMQGKGKVLIADVSDGIENGPAAAFSGNRDSYDPEFLFRSASEGGLSALVAPEGALALCARDFAGEVPLFMKISHSVVLNSWHGQYRSSTLSSAQQLGCVGVAVTLAVGADDFSKRVDELAALVSEARSLGLLALVSVARAGQEGDEKKREALPLDQAAQAVHLACQAGAHIVEAPSLDLPVVSLRDWYTDRQIPVKTHEERAEQLMLSAFQKQRLVLFRFSRYWDDEQTLERVGAWTSAGTHGLNLSSHFYRHPNQHVFQEMSKYQEVLLGESHE